MSRAFSSILFCVPRHHVSRAIPDVSRITPPNPTQPLNTRRLRTAIDPDTAGDTLIPAPTSRMGAFSSNLGSLRVSESMKDNLASDSNVGALLPTDAQLVEQTMAGKRHAFDELIRRHA